MSQFGGFADTCGVGMLLASGHARVFTLPSGNSINNNAKLHPSILYPADVVSPIKIVLYPCRTLIHGFMCAPPAAVTLSIRNLLDQGSTRDLEGGPFFNSL